jgi:predicted PurR-regulated permease PerM
MPSISPEKIKQTYFLLALTVLAALLGYLLRSYISSFLGATTIYILLRRPLYILIDKRKWNKTLTVASLMLLSVIVMVLPLALVSVMLSSKAQYMVAHYAEFLEIIKGWNNTLTPYIGIDLLSDDTLHKITAAGADFIPGILSATVSSVAQIAVMYFLLYFMMMEGRQIENWVISHSPFQNDNTRILISELRTQTVSNAIGMPILVIVQGICAGIGYWIFGMDEPLFWAAITGFAAVLPLVGTGIIWLPVAIYLYFNLGHWQGLGVGIYSALILTNVDNIVRFVVLKRLGNTHPLVTFFGIVIGLDLFGFLGLIFGPLLISYFIILLEIYQREYLEPESMVTSDIIHTD